MGIQPKEEATEETPLNAFQKSPLFPCQCQYQPGRTIDGRHNLELGSTGREKATFTYTDTMSEYLPISSPFGTLWMHHCPVLARGPEWARRERIVVDAGPRDSHIVVRGVTMPFHLHLFRSADGRFHFSERDRRKLPTDVQSELEALINSLVPHESSSPHAIPLGTQGSPKERH